MNTIRQCGGNRLASDAVERSPPPNCREAGFTLVELIIALALLALMFAALAGILRFGIKASALGTKANETQSVHAANQFLTETIARARPIYRILRAGETMPLTRAPPKPQLVFSGTPTTLTFVANLPGRTTVAGLHEVSLRFEAPQSDEAVGALMVKTVLYRPHGMRAQSEEDKSDAAQPLVRQIAGMTVSYFGSVARDAPRVWHTHWQGHDRLPEQVRITVRFADGDDRVWPRTDIRLRLR